jgi:hypothetical protein
MAGPGQIEAAQTATSQAMSGIGAAVHLLAPDVPRVNGSFTLSIIFVALVAGDRSTTL